MTPLPAHRPIPFFLECGGRSFLLVDRRLHAAFIGAIRIGGGKGVSCLVGCSILWQVVVISLYSGI